MPEIHTNETAEAVFNDLINHVQAQGMAPEYATNLGAIIKAKSTLATITAEVAGAIEEGMVRNDAAVVDNGNAIFRSAEPRLSADVRENIVRLRERVQVDTMSDLTPAEPGERVLIRQEIDQILAQATAGRGGSGSPFVPGQSALVALTALAKSNPSRYAAEIAGDYGRIKLQAAGEANFASALVRNIVLSTPGQTPKAQAARALLPVVDRALGSVVALSSSAKERINQANKPPKMEWVGGRLTPVR